MRKRMILGCKVHTPGIVATDVPALKKLTIMCLFQFALRMLIRESPLTSVLSLLPEAAAVSSRWRGKVYHDIQASAYIGVQKWSEKTFTQLFV